MGCMHACGKVRDQFSHLYKDYQIKLRSPGFKDKHPYLPSEPQPSRDPCWLNALPGGSVAAIVVKWLELWKYAWLHIIWKMKLNPGQRFVSGFIPGRCLSWGGGGNVSISC